MEWHSTLNGEPVRLTAEEVTERLRGVAPGRIQIHAVEVEGVWYPMRQAFAVAAGVPRVTVNTPQAWSAFGALGFRCSARPRERLSAETGDRPPLRPPPEFLYCLPQEEVVLELGSIVLEWCWWEWWTDLRADRRTGEGVGMPRAAGVYEARLYGEEQRLYIGRACNLERRVRHSMISGASEHDAGRRIEANEDLSRVCVRWASTDRPAAVEEELLRRHMQQFGALPKYCEHTEVAVGLSLSGDLFTRPPAPPRTLIALGTLFAPVPPGERGQEDEGVEGEHAGQDGEG